MLSEKMIAKLHVKKYLLKFILKEEGPFMKNGLVTLTTGRPISCIILSNLRYKKEMRYSCDVADDDFIRIMIPQKNNKMGNFYLGVREMKMIQSVIYQLFLFKLEMFIQSRLSAFTRKESIKAFLNMYDIIPGEDIDIDNLIKSNFRYRIKMVSII